MKLKKIINDVEGYFQPKTSLNDNYYNLLEKKTMQWQAELMRRFSIDGLFLSLLDRSRKMSINSLRGERFE